MQRILFQGDSITDAGRNRENDRETGRGYPTLVWGVWDMTSRASMSFQPRRQRQPGGGPLCTNQN